MPFSRCLTHPIFAHGEETRHSQKARQNPEIQSAPARRAADRAGAGGTAQSRDQPRRCRHGLGHRPAAAAGNSWDRRAGGEAAAHRARASTKGTSEDVAKRDVVEQGLEEAPQANYGTSATIPTLDPELARQLGLPTAEDDDEALARPPRNKMEAFGVKATADALENLIRDGRPEFKGDDGQVKIWTPHRPPRPEKSEGGVRFVIKSEYEPKGDQPTAIAELVEGINRNDRTQVLLGVTGSGKTYTMAKVIEATQRPAIILAPNKTLAAQLYGEFKNFFPDNAVEYFV